MMTAKSNFVTFRRGSHPCTVSGADFTGHHRVERLFSSVDRSRTSLKCLTSLLKSHHLSSFTFVSALYESHNSLAPYYFSLFNSTSLS